MIAKIHNYLKVFVTENQIPLQQVLTERDLVQLSVTIANITDNPDTKEFNNIANTIFEPLGDKGMMSILHSISEHMVTHYNTKLDEDIGIVLLGYYCMMYLKISFDLPVEKMLFVVNTYMNNHKVKNSDVHKIDLNNPISNPIRIDSEHYVRYNGRTIQPPTDDVKAEFKTQITNLLIKKTI